MTVLSILILLTSTNLNAQTFEIPTGYIEAVQQQITVNPFNPNDYRIVVMEEAGCSPRRTGSSKQAAIYLDVDETDRQTGTLKVGVYSVGTYTVADNLLLPGSCMLNVTITEGQTTVYPYSIGTTPMELADQQTATLQIRRPATTLPGTNFSQFYVKLILNGDQCPESGMPYTDTLDSVRMDDATEMDTITVLGMRRYGICTYTVDGYLQPGSLSIISMSPDQIFTYQAVIVKAPSEFVPTLPPLEVAPTKNRPPWLNNVAATTIIQFPEQAVRVTQSGAYRLQQWNLIGVGTGSVDLGVEIGGTMAYHGYMTSDFQVGGSFRVGSTPLWKSVQIVGSAGVSLGIFGFSIPCLETRDGIVCGQQEDFNMLRPLPSASLPLQIGLGLKRWGFGIELEPALGYLPAGSMTTWGKAGKKTDVPYSVEQSLQRQLPVGGFVRVNL